MAKSSNTALINFLESIYEPGVESQDFTTDISFRLREQYLINEIEARYKIALSSLDKEKNDLTHAVRLLRRQQEQSFIENKNQFPICSITAGETISKHVLGKMVFSTTSRENLDLFTCQNEIPAIVRSENSKYQPVLSTSEINFFQLESDSSPSTQSPHISRTRILSDSDSCLSSDFELPEPVKVIDDFADTSEDSANSDAGLITEIIPPVAEFCHQHENEIAISEEFQDDEMLNALKQINSFSSPEFKLEGTVFKNLKIF